MSGFTCPLCGRTSYNPTDVRERWCGNCRGLTADEPPPGFRWVRFEGGPHGVFGRMMQEGYVELGSEYTTVVDDARYAYDGERFVYQESP